jgi:hypothetical protein
MQPITGGLRRTLAMRTADSGVSIRTAVLLTALVFIAILSPASQLVAAEGDEEIISTIEKDAIPAIDEPTFDDGGWLTPEDKVIVHWLENGSAKAYPMRVLNFHEIVNDVVDGRPLAVTFCPLCGTSISWNRTVGGNVTTFGTSGKLFQNTMVMYDRATDTLWSQHTGVALEGALEGETLEWETNLMTTVGWLVDNADEIFYLARERDEYDRLRFQYHMENPYAYYEETEDVDYPVGDVAPDILSNKTRVLGYLPLNGTPIAVEAAEIIRNSPTILPYLADSEVLAVEYAGDTRLYLWNSSLPVEVIDDVIVTAVANWSVKNGSVLSVNESGQDGDGGVESGHGGDNNSSVSSLVAIPFVRNYWFGWYDFHPDTILFQGPWVSPPPLYPDNETDNQTGEPYPIQDFSKRFDVGFSFEEKTLRVKTVGDYSDVWLELTDGAGEQVIYTGGEKLGAPTYFSVDDVDWVDAPSQDEMSALRRNLTVIDFAASWCSLCELQFDSLADWSLSNPSYSVLTVWADPADTEDEWNAVGFDTMADWPVASDGGSLYFEAGSPPLPAQAILGSDGRLLAVHSGLASKDDLNQLMAEFPEANGGYAHYWEISVDYLGLAMDGQIVLSSAEGELESHSLQSLPDIPIEPEDQLPDDQPQDDEPAETDDTLPDGNGEDDVADGGDTSGNQDSNSVANSGSEPNLSSVKFILIFMSLLGLLAWQSQGKASDDEDFPAEHGEEE